MLGTKSLVDLICGLFWATLVILRWIQAQFFHPLAEWWLENVLGTWEESLKSVIREAFGNLTRVVNGFFTSVVSLFVDREYGSAQRYRWSRTAAWQNWWGQERNSTFNALIRRDQGRHSQDGRTPKTGSFPTPGCSLQACMHVGFDMHTLSLRPRQQHTPNLEACHMRAALGVTVP